MKTQRILLSSCLLTAAINVLAQDSPNSEIINPPSLPANIRVGPVTFDEPFVDEGNTTAKRLATLEGISTGQATKRLRHMHNAGRLARALIRDEPETFAGIIVERDGRIVVKTKGESSETVRRSITNVNLVDSDVSGSVSFESAPRSLKELRLVVADIVKQQKTLDLKFHVAIDKDNNSLKILTQDEQSIERAIQAGQLKLPEYASVELSEPIVLTADIYGGRGYNNNTSTGCTTGFVVIRASDSKRGVTSAGHCPDPGSFNTNLGCPTCSSGNISITLQREWVTDKDIAWYTATSSHVFPPVWWDGSSYPQVKGAKVSVTGDYVCKFGRRTGLSCGYVSAEEVWNPDYGAYFSVVPANSNYPQMVDVGDSGGPVWFSTNTAVGTSHAKRGGDLLYGEIAWLDYHNTGISVLKTY